MANRIATLFERKPDNILSIYFTAGYPKPKDTVPVLEALADSGVDLVEIGMPYSDPIADGPTIQDSSQQALANGMNIARLFDQLEGIRERVDIPLILMGYLNPVMQYGLEAFCQRAEAIGIDGLIIPDMPLYAYEAEYAPLLKAHKLTNIFLITPQTPESRIRTIAAVSEGFIYMVSSAAITGAKNDIAPEQRAYFERIAAMNLRLPRLIGFGISNAETFQTACQYAQGAIIGSAFIKALKGASDPLEATRQFVASIRAEQPV